MEKDKKLIIVGAGEFGDIAYEYFSFDSSYEVAAFAVENKYLNSSEHLGLPLIDIDCIEEKYPCTEYEVFVALSYVQLNRARRKLYLSIKEKGYTCASYVSSSAFVWHNVKISENVFIFENNTIQYKAVIGNNVILWSGCNIGHRTVIEDDCWLAPHSVISGLCKIGKGSFVGVNAAVGDNITIGADTVLGAGAVVIKNLQEAGCVYVGNPVRKIDRTSYEQFNVKE